MQRIAATLRLALLLALFGVLGFNTGVQAHDAYASDGILTVQLAELPPEAQQTLLLVQRGGPFPYPYKDGSTFGNFEKRLPHQTRGYYREYTVPTPGRRDRGPRRIIAGSGTGGNVATSGEYYYTGDHYRSFRRIHKP